LQALWQLSHLKLALLRKRRWTRQTLAIKRRTRLVRIFPNTESCLRLIRVLCVETHETWLEDNRYLNMSLLAAQKNEALRLAA